MNWLKHWTSRAALAAIVILLVAGLATSFPADIAFLMAIDLGTWVEAAVAVYVVAQFTKIRPILTFVRARLFSQQRSPKRRRPRIRPGKQPANDDDPAGRWAFAA